MGKTPIEGITKALLESNSSLSSQKLFEKYLTTKKALVTDILEEIKRVMPDHTDHGPRHIENVLENASELLGLKDDSYSDQSLTALEFYCLIMGIIFHDVGNLYDREDHREKVSEIYNHTQSNASFRSSEKQIILNLAKAHCGTASDGSEDTMIDLDIAPVSLYGKPINMRQIAPILRFADELAEGKQRTSSFLLSQGLYPEKNELFQQYASFVEVCIDRGNSRIALSYKIDISELVEGEDYSKLEIMLKMVFFRILKLDTERKYAKFYCPLLEVFKKTIVNITFWNGRDEISLAQNYDIAITDLVIPGEINQDISAKFPELKIESMIDQIQQALVKK